MKVDISKQKMIRVSTCCERKLNFYIIDIVVFVCKVEYLYIFFSFNLTRNCDCEESFMTCLPSRFLNGPK